MKYEHRILTLGFVAGLGGSAMSFFLLWQSDYSTQTRLTLAALVLFVWVTTALVIRDKVAFPLRTLVQPARERCGRGTTRSGPGARASTTPWAR